MILFENFNELKLSEKTSLKSKKCGFLEYLEMINPANAVPNREDVDNI